jgi:hypothetical protein
MLCSVMSGCSPADVQDRRDVWPQRLNMSTEVAIQVCACAAVLNGCVEMLADGVDIEQ